MIKINKILLGKGFTLTELLITVAIVAILGGMATPSFMTIIEKNKTITFVSDFRTAMYLAQSEAIKRNSTVTILPKARDTREWQNGWDVFEDTNSNGVKETTEELISTHTFSHSGYTLKATDNTYKKWISFNAMGVPVSSNGNEADSSFRICPPDNDVSAARTLNISLSGNIIVTEGASSCP
ncbi:MAG: Pilus assembly protein FimT [uncultured Thiotrichaceae bacterium]|uniref:Type II secretion system protein H n=1 Tax=uncultured Thiotrichaceae bacterium TaxID=298394 RepID=A0A6S6SGF1_9GAMM|nr:MAG: Pilus assembly protein FimT [uncultured Thiotrichaceae bacterium]